MKEVAFQGPQVIITLAVVVEAIMEVVTCSYHFIVGDGAGN